MALAITYKGKIASTTAATSYTATTSWTPTADSLLVAFVVTCLGSSPVDPTTVSGHGQTYSKLTGFSAYTLSTTHLLSIWVAKAGSSPTSTAASASYGAVNQTGGVVIEYEITDADLSGTAAQAFIQTVTANGSATSHTGTNLLNAAGSSDNRAMAFYVHLANEATTPAGGNWTETSGADGNFNTPATGAEVQHTASTFDRTPAASWTTSSAYRVFAVEIKRNQNVTVTLTGLGATAAQGTLTATPYDAAVSWAELDVPSAGSGTSVSLTGLQATAAQTMPGVLHTQGLTGQEATAAQTMPTVAHAQPLTGQEATGAITGPSVARSKALTGLEATAGLTGPSVAHTQPLAGLEATAAQTMPTPQSGYQVALTGLQATAAQTMPGVAHTQPVTGLDATTAITGPTVAHAQGLTGQEATAAQTSPTAAVAKALTGLEATGAITGPSVLHAQGLAGAQAAVEQGTITPQQTGATTVALTGLEATVAQTGPGVSHAQGLTGLEATGAITGPSVAHTQGLTGQEATAAQTMPGVAHVQGLTGLEATVAGGMLTPLKTGATSVALTGLQATVEQGAMTPVGGTAARTSVYQEFLRYASTARVYAPDSNIGGTVYTLTLDAVQNSTASLVATLVGLVKHLTFNVSTVNTVWMTKQTTHSFSVTQNSTNQVYTDTTLNAALTTVSQNSTATVRRLLRFVRSVTQSSTIQFIAQFISGGAHSTFFITLDAVQSSVVSITKGIQTIKRTIQASVVDPVSWLVTPLNTVLLTLNAVQNSVASLVKQSQIALLTTQNSVGLLAKMVQSIKATVQQSVASMLASVAIGPAHHHLMTLTTTQRSKASLVIVPPLPIPTSYDPYFIARAAGRKFIARAEPRLIAKAAGRKFVAKPRVTRYQGT